MKTHVSRKALAAFYCFTLDAMIDENSPIGFLLANENVQDIICFENRG